MNSLLYRTLVLSILLVGGGIAAPQPNANSTRELFKLEKIPLQVHTIKEMSVQLLTLSQRPQDKSAAQRRASAQMLALATRLDPMNQQAREAEIAIKKGKIIAPVDKDRELKAKSKLRVYRQWLSSPEAGKDANLLANHLVDATKTLNGNTINNVDLCNWDGLVSNFYAAEEKPTQKKPEVAINKPTENQNTTGGNPQKKPKAPTVKFQITKLKCHAPLNTFSYKERFSLEENRKINKKVPSHGISPINIAITNQLGGDDSHTPSLQFSFSPQIPQDYNIEKNLQLGQTIDSTLKSLILSRHPNLPNAKINIDFNKSTYERSNKLAVTAPIAVMLEASITKQPLRDDIHFCAAIKSDGKLSRPENFWRLIQILRKSETGGRLIVAEEGVELLIQLLVFGEPDFFTRWEVFSAATLDDAMHAATQTPPSNIDKAHKIFATIQGLTKKSEVTQLAVNKVVRQRLGEVVQLAPNHISAKVLLVQGGTKRPMRFSEKALAHELLPTITRIDQFMLREFNSRIPGSAKLKAFHKKLRAKLDPIERMIDRSHADLYESTVKLSNGFRRLMTVARRLENDYELYAPPKSTTTLIFDMKGQAGLLRERATQLTQP